MQNCFLTFSLKKNRTKILLCETSKKNLTKIAKLEVKSRKRELHGARELNTSAVNFTLFVECPHFCTSVMLFFAENPQKIKCYDTEQKRNQCVKKKLYGKLYRAVRGTFKIVAGQNFDSRGPRVFCKFVEPRKKT